MSSHHPNTSFHPNTIDLTGQRFTRLVVLAYAGLRKRRTIWTCQCACGKVKDIPAKTLLNGTARSCGCLRKEMMQNPATSPRRATVSLLGETIGFWTVIAHAGVRKGHTWWTCQCVCGTVKDRPAYHLKRKDSLSCGCKQGMLLQMTHTTHGRSYTAEHHVWTSMLQRCHNPNAQNYALYGGRGITVCEAWRNSFEAFLADMGPRPSAEHSIDRINNDGPYNRKNTRWTTRDVQAVNRRTTIWIEYNGQKRTAQQWSKTPEVQAIGIQARNILERLRNGWPVEDALTVPVSPNNNGLHRRHKAAYYGTFYTSENPL